MKLRERAVSESNQGGGDSGAELREQWSAEHPAGEAGIQEEEKERIPGKMRKHWKRRMTAAVLAISVWITSLSLDTVQVNADLIKRYIPSVEFDRTQNLTVDPLSYLEEKDKEKSQQHYILEEALERRDEGVKHFVMEDGSGAAVVYGKPVHYEEEGEWKEIDNRLEKTEGEDGKEYYQNTASDVRIRLAGEALAEKLVSISNDGKELSWKLSAGNGEEGTEETGSGEGTEGAAGESSAEEGTSGEPASEEVLSEEGGEQEKAEPEQEAGAASDQKKGLPGKELSGRAREEAASEAGEKSQEETGSGPAPVLEATKEEAAGTSAEPVRESERETGAADSTGTAGETMAETGTDEPLESAAEPTAEEAAGLKNAPFQKQEQEAPQFQWRRVPGQPALYHAGSAFPETEEEKEAYNQEMSAVLNLEDGGVYREILPGIDLQYVLDAKTLKENITLKNAEAEISALRFLIDHTGCVMEKEEDGSLRVTDRETGEVVYTMQAPFLEDSKGAYSDGVSYVLEPVDESRTRLSFRVEESWLLEEGRAWPVVIDPITVTDSYQNIQDTFVSSRMPGTSFSDYGKFNVGNDSTSYGLMRGYIRFLGFPQLEPGDAIYDARIYYYCGSFSSNGDAPFYIVAREPGSAWNNSITWNSQPAIGQAGPVLDWSTMAPLGGIYRQKYINVTRVIKKWYREGSSNKGLVLTLANESTPGNVSFVSGSKPDVPSALYPTGYFFYRNALGLESYWSTHTQQAGTAGTGYVCDFNGNLVFVHGDTQTTSLRMSAGVSHIYNAANLDKDDRYGKGWTLDKYQSLEPTTGKIKENGFLYVYLDGDGTKHYFYKDNNKLIDEDGLGLTIIQESSSNNDLYRIIEDKDGNRMVFDIWGKLRRFQDLNGNTVSMNYSPHNDGNYLSTMQDASGNMLSFHYTEGYRHLSSITDEAGRSIRYGYDASGKLTSVTYPDGSSSKYFYDGGGRLSGARSADGYQVNYEYVLDMGVPQVSKVYESSGNSTGRSMKIEYPSVGTTVFTGCGPDGALEGTADNQVTTYHFDSYGRTVDLHDEEGAAANYRFYSEGAKANKLETEGSMQKTVRNLALNGGAHDGWSYFDVWSFGGDEGSQAVDAGTGFLDLSSFKLYKGTAAGGREWFSRLGVKPGTTYTLSAYVKTKNVSGNGRGAYLVADDLNGTKAYSRALKGTTESAVDDGWQRLSVTFTTGKSQNTVSINGGLEGCSGEAWFDNIQLEEGEAANRYNLLTNSGFETGSGGSAYGWIRSGSSQGSEAVSGAQKWEGSQSYTMTGDPAQSKHLCQQVKVSGREGDVYTLSGWAKLDAIPDTRVSLAAAVLYDSGDPKWVELDYNYYVDGWQYVSGIINTDDQNASTSRKYLRIDVYVFYDNNYNKAYFDGFQMCKDDAPTYVYDSKGNLISAVEAQEQSRFQYDGKDNLTKVVDPVGTEFTYTYDEKKNLTKAESSEGLVYQFTNDGYGNPTQVKITGGGSLQMQGSLAYDATGKQLTKTTASDGTVITYGYDGNLRLKTSQTDPGGTTNYGWNSVNDRLTSVSRQGSGGNSVVEYQYDAAGIITMVRHNGFDYKLNFDSFGNTASVSAGGQTLVTNEYLTNNGELSKVTYGNGQNMSYEYYPNGRLKRVKQGDRTVCTNIYDGEGRLYRQITPECPEGIQYHYDTLGRLIGLSGNIELRIKYDEINRVDTVTTIIEGKTTSTQYCYGAETSNRSQLKEIKVNGIPILSYEMDGLQRHISRTYPDAGGYKSSWKYKDGMSGNATVLPERIINGNDKLEYKYDSMNNVIEVRENGTLTQSYEYDSLNQMIRENDVRTGVSTVYSYDTGGNLLSKKHYEYTTGSLEGKTLKSEDTYGYQTDGWKDLLKSYNGGSISYDGSGNAVKWRGNIGFSWTSGKFLASVTGAGQEISYTYDVDGNRTSKTVGGVKTVYYLSGSQILGQKKNNEQMDFLYDEEGKVTGLDYNGSRYYYIRNAQSDVIGLIDKTGTQVVKYTYDAWGRVLSVTGSLATTLGRANPFRFKGYYYDLETGLYYLQTRYYDPVVGRFISADTAAVLLARKMDVTEKNLFVYCNNNPINFSDPNGQIIGLIIGAGLLVSAISGVSMGVSAEMCGQDFWKGFKAGCAGGAVGYLFTIGGHPIAGRGAATFTSDLYYEYLLNGNLDNMDWALFTADVLMDMSLELPFALQGEGIAAKALGAIPGSVIDGTIDVGQTAMYFTPEAQASIRDTSPSSGNGNAAAEYVSFAEAANNLLRASYHKNGIVKKGGMVAYIW